MKPEPRGERHSWQQIEFEKEGAPLWHCVKCGEDSYHDIPDYRGCFPKAEGDTSTPTCRKTEKEAT